MPIEENMIDTLLIKVGLPGHGTLSDKITRLNRNGIFFEGQPASSKPMVVDVVMPEKVMEDMAPPYEETTEVLKLAKRGRPKKVK